jgi:hypothetical protein
VFRASCDLLVVVVLHLLGRCDTAEVLRRCCNADQGGSTSVPESMWCTVDLEIH